MGSSSVAWRPRKYEATAMAGAHRPGRRRRHQQTRADVIKIVARCETTSFSSGHPNHKRSRVLSTKRQHQKAGWLNHERHLIFAPVAPRTQSPAQNQDKFKNEQRSWAQQTNLLRTSSKAQEEAKKPNNPKMETSREVPEYNMRSGLLSTGR